MHGDGVDDGLVVTLDGGMSLTALADLKRGALAVISAVSGVQFSSKHLADMGFVRGAKVEMLRPGSPCIVKIGDAVCVALGNGYQERISVEALEAPRPSGPDEIDGGSS